MDILEEYLEGCNNIRSSANHSDTHYDRQSHTDHQDKSSW